MFAGICAHAIRSADGLPPFWLWLKAGFGPACVAAATLGCIALAWCVYAAARKPPPPSLSTWI
jgi:hypothetical protein